MSLNFKATKEERSVEEGEIEKLSREKDWCALWRAFWLDKIQIFGML